VHGVIGLLRRLSCHVALQRDAQASRVVLGCICMLETFLQRVRGWCVPPAVCSAQATARPTAVEHRSRHRSDANCNTNSNALIVCLQLPLCIQVALRLLQSHCRVSCWHEPCAAVGCRVRASHRQGWHLQHLGLPVRHSRPCWSDRSSLQGGLRHGVPDGGLRILQI
jgi:hypothetical protein